MLISLYGQVNPSIERKNFYVYLWVYVFVSDFGIYDVFSKHELINFHGKLLDCQSHPVMNPVDQFLLFEKLPVNQVDHPWFLDLPSWFVQLDLASWSLGKLLRKTDDEERLRGCAAV